MSILSRFKLSRQVLNQYEALAIPARQHVDDVIKRHLAACAKHDVEPEVNDQFIAEAITDYKAGKGSVLNMPSVKGQPMPARWAYDVYVSPTSEDSRGGSDVRNRNDRRRVSSAA